MTSCYCSDGKQVQWRLLTTYANDLEQQHTGWAHWMLLFLLRLWLFFFLFLFFILFFFPPSPSSFFPSLFLFILLFPSYVMKSNRKGRREPAFNKHHLCLRHCPWWYHMHNLIQSSDNASRKFLIFPFYRGRTQALLKSSELVTVLSLLTILCLPHH